MLDTEDTSSSEKKTRAATPDEPRRFSSEDPRLRHTEPVLAYGQMLRLAGATTPAFPPQRLIAMIAQHPWEETFLQLSRVAALLANSEDGGHGREIRARTTDLLASTLHSENVEERLVAFYARLNEPCIIAHEEVVYFLQALTILYGGGSGPAPTDAQIAFWMLAGNDHCFDWRQEDRPLSDVEYLVAASTRSLLYNHEHDPLRDFVRAVTIWERPPPRTAEWRDLAAWQQFQARALGCPFEEHLDSLAGSLFVISIGWGMHGEEGLRNPMLVPDEWIEGTGVRRDLAEPFFERISAGRTELRQMITPFVGADGLPRGSSVFYLKPFVRFTSGQLVPASPWAVREQVRAATWAKLLEQAKAEYGDHGGASRWHAAFGDLFELWCRDVARTAAASKRFPGQVILSANVGDEDEIEDVVVVRDGCVLLVSAKARMVRHELLKGALSAAQAVDWYDDFLFGKRKGNQRAGAARLLHEKVERIRAGEFAERGVPADSHIFPMLVTFDHLGADNPAFYQWSAERCAAQSVLRHSKVHRLVVLSIERFEGLMGFAATGGDIFDLLARCGPEERVDVALHDATQGLDSVRLPEFERRYDHVMARLQARISDALRGERSA